MSKIGRDDWIRTSDPLTPSQVRYQAALHPDSSARPYASVCDRRRGRLRFFFAPWGPARPSARTRPAPPRAASGAFASIADNSRRPRFTCRIRSRASAPSSSATSVSAALSLPRPRLLLAQLAARARPASALRRRAGASAAAPARRRRDGRRAGRPRSSRRRDPGIPPPTIRSTYGWTLAISQTSGCRNSERLGISTGSTVGIRAPAKYSRRLLSPVAAPRRASSSTSRTFCASARRRERLLQVRHPLLAHAPRQDGVAGVARHDRGRRCRG